RGKSVEIEEGDAMHDGTTYFHYTLEADQRLIIDFIFSQQLGVVAEVAQKPGAFPNRFGNEEKAMGDQTSGEVLGLENSETDLVIRFLGVPAIRHPINW